MPHRATEPAGLAAGGSFQLATVHGRLNVLQEREVIPSYATLTKEALDIDWRGRCIRVCSLERLRKMNGRLTGRDLEALADAHRDESSFDAQGSVRA